MADLSGNVPRVIALIDLPDLQWQVKRIGGAFGHDVTAVLQQLEAGVAKLDPAPEARLSLGVVYVYSPLEADRPPEAERVVFRQRATEVERQCWGCYKACTHCQGGTVDLGGRAAIIRLPTIFSNSPAKTNTTGPSSSAVTCCSSRWSGISSHTAGRSSTAASLRSRRTLPRNAGPPSTSACSIEDSTSPQQPHRYLSVTTRGFMKWGR